MTKTESALLIRLSPPQIFVRGTPGSGHESDGPEQLRLVAIADSQRFQAMRDAFDLDQEFESVPPLVRELNNGNCLDPKEAETLRDELFYHRAVHTYTTM